MIFSSFFTPAYKHSDAQKRLESIPKLEPANEKHKEILHELGFNDVSADVSKAALNKLASFTLWLKAYESHIHPKVQQAAKDIVLAMMEDESQVSRALFVDIIQQERHRPLVQELLFNSDRLLKESSLPVSALLSSSTDNEVRRFYKERASEQQQRDIIDAADEKQLRKLKKLSESEALAKYIDSRIVALEEAAALPKKVIASATLINSRLLALCDLLDYALIEEKKHTLVREFDALKSDFVILDDETSSELSSKYFMLKEKVDKRLAALEGDYMAHLHLKGVSDAISDIETRANTIFEQIDMLGQSDNQEQLDSQIELFTRSIDDLRLEIKDLNLNLGDKAELEPSIADEGAPTAKVQTTAAHRKAISSLQSAFSKHSLALEHLPAQITRNRQAGELIAQAKEMFEASALGEENTDSGQPLALNDVLKQLEHLATKGLCDQHQNDVAKLLAAYKQQKNAQLAQMKSVEKRCLSKLNACKGMIEQGKFKAAIATFNGAQKLLEQMNDKDNVSNALNKRYEQVHEKISELKDWQSYIAAPKKPELIGLAKTLANNKDIDVAERAALVKQYRSEFVSIGRLNTSDDDALNTEFDQAIEQAFEPCRKHYEKLDGLREKNLKKGEQVLEALEALSSVEDPQILSKHLSAISQQYRKLGELHKSARDKLHKQYQKRYKPLQEKVQSFYQANAQTKQALLDKAIKLSESDDVEAAVSEAKALQAKWKSIGFAGAKQDQTLWEGFRLANDAVFSRLKASKDEQTKELNKQKATIEVKLKVISKQISGAEQLADLNDVDAQLEDISTLIADLPKPQQASLQTKLQAQRKGAQAKVKEFDSQKQSAVMQNVFNQLEHFTGDTPDEAFTEQLQNLPANIKQAFESKLSESQQSNVLQGMSRKEINTAAHILLADGKGLRESKLKKDVQLKLMAAKLEGESMPNAQDLLLHWIGCGALDEQDQALLNKLKPLYGVE